MPLKLRLIHLLAAAGLLIAATAQAESYGFKTATLGSHLGLIANNPKYDCRAVKTPTADRVCSLGKDETETMAGVPLRSVFYFYDQSALTGIVIHLDEARFQTVVDALATKYGPAKRSSETVKNLSGKAFENVIHTWRQGNESIVAQRYSGRLDQSSIRISDDTATARIKQRREQNTRQPERDL
jgi:hypothetical protein